MLQVWRGTEWVSGLVVCRAGRARVKLLAAGLHPSQFERRQGGALPATYYFLFRWARENRLRAVDFCGSRPHLADGVFRHKTLWAAEPKPDPWHHTKTVFYVAAAAPLPEVVTRQLAWRDGRFVSIGELRTTVA